MNRVALVNNNRSIHAPWHPVKKSICIVQDHFRMSKQNLIRTGFSRKENWPKN